MACSDSCGLHRMVWKLAQVLAATAALLCYAPFAACIPIVGDCAPAGPK